MMDIIDYIHTKKGVIKKIYSSYLDGLSEDEIYAKYFGKYDMEMIRNIIDCYNFINI